MAEYKIEEFDGSLEDFQREMQSLVSEDARPARGEGKAVEEAGEAGARYDQQKPATPQASAPSAEPAIDFESEGDFDMARVLADQMGYEFVSLDDYPPTDYKVLKRVPSDLAKQYRVYPLDYDQETNTMTLALADPSDPTIVDDLKLTLDCDIQGVVASEADINDRIAQSYGVGEETIETLLDEVSGEADQDVIEVNENIVDLTDMDALQRESGIKKLTNLILLQAIRDNASDLHIEPFDQLVRIRYRVDGVLREMRSPPKEMQSGLISRLKVMANLDIAESRRPQDGRIMLALPDNQEVEMRLTTSPTVHGESIVMRVLDKSMMQMGISQVGLSQEVLADFLKQCQKPNGIVLVTGPTGSGKTTTLYAVINEIKNLEDKLITTEDPVEYQVDGIIQVNINESVGLTYARCLRAILRQDPDRILVGEIRDLPTARISIEAALTGHMVFSTLHTNSAAGTITRLIDMGVEPFLITSTLQAVIGQRLVRTVCPNCREEYDPDDEELQEFGVKRDELQDMVFYHGQGCEECGFTGYRGRIGVFEYLPVTEEIADLILEQATTDDIHATALRQGMVSLRQDGWLKICMGMTTFAEVASHTPQESAPMESPQETLDTEKAPTPEAVEKTLTKGEEAAPHNLPGLME